MLNWYNGDDVLNNLLATLIWVIFASALGLILKRPITRLLRKILPQIDSSIPHIDFSMAYNRNGDYKTDVIIANHGGEPAYDVYVFLYSHSYIDENYYSLKSLGESDVRSGVLGAGKEAHFDNVDLMFDGCSLTAKEEIWVEYNNSAGVQFRTRVTPPSPRGDSLRVFPPKVIKKRLELMPNFHQNFNDNRWKKFEDGKATLFPTLGGYHKVRDKLRRIAKAFIKLMN